MKLHHISSSMMFVNTYLLMDEASGEAALIDPGFSNPDLFPYLEQCPYRLKYLIATHGHGDHTALLGQVQQRFGGQIAIHEADAHFLTSDEARSMFRGSGLTFEPAAPDILLHHGDCLSLGDSVIEVLHTPGHTPGGVCLRCDPYLFTGDTLFHDDVGRTDFPGGSAQQLRHSISVVLGAIEEDLQVLPGHEEFSTLSHEKAHNPFFQTL